MKISILIPTYNQEKFIKQAIESALQQTYPNLEVVVCDDCSTDGTWEVVQSINDPRLRTYRNSKNLGRVGNYRRLLYELANGDYVLNLDGDDYLLYDNYIQEATGLIKKFGTVLVFANQYMGYGNKFKQTNMKLPAIVDGNWLFMNFLKNGIHIPHLTALYHRQSAIKADFYQKDIVSSDWHSFLRLIVGKKVGFVPKPVGVWRQLDDSESKKGDVGVFIENIEALLEICNDKNVKKEIPIQQCRQWQKQLIYNLLRSIPVCVVAQNLNKLCTYAYKKLGIVSFLKLIFSRFSVKGLIGKFRCVES